MSLLVTVAASETGEKAGFSPLELWHFPSQIFWTLLLFTLLYFVLSRMILPKIGSTIETRENRIADDLAEAKAFSDRAEAAQASLETRMAEARAKARDTANEAKAKIDAEIAMKTAAVDTEIDTTLEKAEAEIMAERAGALKDIESIAADALRSITGQFDVTTSAKDAKSTVSAVLAKQGS